MKFDVIFIIRIVQAVLAIIVLGLTAHGTLQIFSSAVASGN